MLLGAILLGGCADDGEPASCYVRDNLTTREVCEMLTGICEPQTGALPAISEMVQVVPDAAAMPDGVVSQISHNNLDIVWHDNRLFFAFRTAPTHFASEDVVMYVVSTADHVNWTLEATFAMRSDLREPRFLSFDGKLFFYFAVLGYIPVSFEPQYSMVSEYRGGCNWTEPERIFDDGFIPWRTRVYDGVPYLMGYIGGETLFEPGGEPTRNYWLTTEDGRNWEPVVPGQPVVLEGGTSEADFAFADDGAMIAVVRNEAGEAIPDGLGWGSKICRAEPDDLGTWTCVGDPKKYDSPLIIRHTSGIYLIARRQVTETGNYDLFLRELTAEEQTSRYNGAYWVTPKRCSLWKVDPDTLAVDWLLDLPSNGDTCFAGAVQLNDDQFLVYNYTSPLDDPELKWVDGQVGNTFIYRVTLTLPPP